MIRHFVEFIFPGSFLSESTVEPIDSWDIAEAYSRLTDLNMQPYGFRFLTRERGPDDLDSKITATSGIYYLGGKIRTFGEVLADNKPEEETLRWNMQANKFHTVIQIAGRTFPFTDKDTVVL